MTDLFERVRQTLGIDIREADLAGGTVSGEIPLSNDAVNRLIAKELQGGNGPVTGARVEAIGDDRFTADVIVRAPVPVPPLRIQASIEQQPQFPGPAVLGVRWTMPALGPLALFAGPALSFLKKLPPGMHVEGDRLTIDVAEILRARGLADLLRYVSGARLHTRRGAFVLRFDLRISS